MNEVTSRRLTGVLLILTPIAFNLLFTLLSVGDLRISRHPARVRWLRPGTVRRGRCRASSDLVRFRAYRRTLSAAGGSGARVLANDGREAGELFYLSLAMTFGVVAGIVQFLGLARSPFLISYLADSYTDPASSKATSSRDLEKVRTAYFHAIMSEFSVLRDT